MDKKRTFVSKTLIFGVLSMLILTCLSSLSSVGLNVNPSNQINKIEGNSDYWRIYGYVRDLLGNKLDNVIVWIVTWDLMWKAKTDSEGFYEFTKIPKLGTPFFYYSMLFEKKGYLERPKIILGKMNVDEIKINAILIRNIFDIAIDHLYLNRLTMLERLKDFI